MLSQSDIIRKSRSKPSAEALERRKLLKQSFPENGKVRANECAAYLGIGVSTFWLYVKNGRIVQPVRFGQRVSVWDASCIHQLAETGIPINRGDNV